jgi:hypothetical protein
MNCGHHNVFSFSFNELICTACSLKQHGEKHVDNSNQRVKSMLFSFRPANYSQSFREKNRHGEQVLLPAFRKIRTINPEIELTECPSRRMLNTTNGKHDRQTAPALVFRRFDGGRG